MQILISKAWVINLGIFYRCNSMGKILTREEGWDLLTKYNKEEFHLNLQLVVQDKLLKKVLICFNGN